MRRHGFTLIEVMVVVMIIAVLAGLIAFLPKGSRRHAAVKSAAEELAATLRAARALAMDRRMVCGVAFHIENAPGSSGLVLNNHTGGHWYRIIGEVQVRDTPDSIATYPRPTFADQNVDGTGNVAQFLDQVQDGWIGERHVLPIRTVRFLALGDQDNGSEGWTGSGRYPATYPRPWCGWWDVSTRRLRGWGSYDSAVVDQNGRSCSAFYFQGSDGPLVGSSNPADRMTTHVGTGSTIPPRRVLTAGETRPVVNANWLDYVIFFYPDGTAAEQSPMANRRLSYVNRGTATEAYRAGGTGGGDLGDFCAKVANMGKPITSYVRHTGVWAVTLAPDAVRDSDAAASAAEAFDMIWPAYRVTVSATGDVRVIQLTRVVPSGTTFDTTSISDWQNASQMNAMYQGGIATNPDGSLRGQPVTDFLTPEVLASRQWWMVSP